MKQEINLEAVILKKYGKTTFIGIIIGLSFVIGGVIATGEADLFWDLPSFFIIVGGTVGSFVMGFSVNDLKRFVPVFKKAFTNDEVNLVDDLLLLINLSEIARRKGLLPLEQYSEDNVEDDFLKEGIMLIVDGADEESLRNKLEGETYYMKQRHQKGAAMMDHISTTAPALGLLGTYVGLIPMLNNLDDPESLGTMMALELVSSFYGAFIAYVIFAPVAKKLKTLSKEEMIRRSILIEGLVAVQERKNPRFTREELASFANISLEELEAAEQEQKMKEEAPIVSQELKQQYES